MQPSRKPVPTTTARPPHRPTYRCSRCGEQKRGHVCIFEQHALTAPLREGKMVDASTQAELDASMTVRALAVPPFA